MKIYEVIVDEDDNFEYKYLSNNIDSIREYLLCFNEVEKHVIGVKLDVLNIMGAVIVNSTMIRTIYLINLDFKNHNRILNLVKRLKRELKISNILK